MQKTILLAACTFCVCCTLIPLSLTAQQTVISPKETLTAPGAEVQKVADGFSFTEGPAADADGNIYFVDDPNSKIHFYSPADKKLSVFVEHSEHANGMYFDRKNNLLLVCEGGTGSIVSYNKKAERTLIAATFEGKRFNKPNDLWLDPKGGIYFTDPVYGKEFKRIHSGEHVYYILPDRKTVRRVINDMIKPNGIVGTRSGKTLYVTDQAAGKVWRYTIEPDGNLTEKTLFANTGVDGMTLDERGNVYVTEKDVVIFNGAGEKMQRIQFPEVPSNVCFGGKDKKTLYVTARKGLYSIRMNVAGLE
ncbi:MAG: SMP-30/gluconolactonase/LRE family protein [Planctomycetaceae bacterium]|jgi:gluconolactonase|nr:SMP-30/gluconolactonase/LRE family protein [Planctomycetaceae bacterium]